MMFLLKIKKFIILKDEKYYFLGVNNKVKIFYELSEIIYYVK